MKQFLNIAFYHFTGFAEPNRLRDELRAICAEIPARLGMPGGLKGTLLLGHEGINGMISGEEACVRELQAYLLRVPGLAEVSFKESWSSQIAFPRMLVKAKKEIIPIGREDIRPAEFTGARIAPTEFRKWLDEGKELYILDTRNDYEIELGTFEGARDLGLKHFRDFAKKLEEASDELKKEIRDKPMVMFCTGGIRCEKASAVAVNLGFKEVYQLDGGILKYFEECGGAHYRGDCFVFDKRIALDPALKESRNIDPEHASISKHKPAQ